MALLTVSKSPVRRPPSPPSSSLIVPDRPHPPLAVDEPHKIVKVIASDGKSGETKDISYTNCKVVGNGSFGVVFQAKLLDGGDGEDIAIKKVLQDKRFKVSWPAASRRSLCSDII